VELVEARAVAELDHPEAVDHDVQPFQEYYDEVSERRDGAEIDAQAAWSKADLRYEDLIARAEALPDDRELEVRKHEPRHDES